MQNPFLIPAPAAISFSGGRTSAYMLYRILQAFGGQVPENIQVVFANTGMEMPETLDFVRDCGLHWGVPIIWLEYRQDSTRGDYKVDWARVTYETASRNGEPYSRAISTRPTPHLPNPVSRYCTKLLKINPMKGYIRSLGWEDWSWVIGLRADEAVRIARLRGSAHEDYLTPLHRAGITKHDVKAFWDAQNFDLHLPNIEGVTPYGNCTLCFLKKTATIRQIMSERPDLAQWWIKQEVDMEARLGPTSGARFRQGRPSYANLLADVQKGLPDPDLPDDRAIDCLCTEDQG